jgi:transcriptional regulator with XRE-family HTH domain
MRTVREGLGMTQAEIARELDTEQGEVSRIERRRDLMLSTAQKYAAALGARCELAFVFGDGRRVIIAEPTGEEPPK